MLELETLTMMYSPGSTAMTYQEFHDWQTGLTRRLEDWHSATHSSVDDVLAKTIQFHDIIYHFLIFRLNRPSPGYPAPDLGMRQQSIRAALKVVNIYATNDRNGMLLYYWHAGYHMFEVGVFLLQFMLGATEAYSSTEFSRIEDVDPAILRDTMLTIMDVLWKVVGRWPEAEASVEILGDLSRPVLEGFEHWVQGHDWHRDLLGSGLEASLVRLTGIWKLSRQQPFYAYETLPASEAISNPASGPCLAKPPPP